jgi:large repetitive protein
VYTKADGMFTYEFTPLPSESGVYSVRVVHPDVTDKPVMGQFTISDVSVTPAVYNISQPYNYTKTYSIDVKAGDGTSVNNLNLVYEAADQVGGTLPNGVYITPGPSLNLASKMSGKLSFTMWADKTASPTSTMKLKVKSDETIDDSWGTIKKRTGVRPSFLTRS